MKTKVLITSLAAILPTVWTLAQDAGGPPRPPGPPREVAGQSGDQGKDKDGPRDGQRPPGPMPIPFLKVLDKDDDGIISADEIKNSPDSLKALDKNNDGKLTRDEWQPQPPRGAGQRKGGPRDGERPSGGPRDGDAKSTEKKAPGAKPPGDAPQKGERPPGPPSALLEALDTDHDGIISADEIGKAPESLAKLDKNNDGQLGPREYGPRPPQGPRDGEKDGTKPAQ